MSFFPQYREKKIVSSKARCLLRYQRIGNSYEYTNLILLPGRERKIAEKIPGQTRNAGST